jgi:hypothetical protein
MLTFEEVKLQIFILSWLVLGAVCLSGQSESLNIADTTSVNIEESINPFDVDHIPIRKNQIDQGGEEITGRQQVEKHFALIIIVGLLSFLATIVTLQRDFFTLIFLSTLKQTSLTDLWRDQGRGKSLVIRLAHLFGLGAISLFCCLALSSVDSGYTQWQLFACIFGGFVGYYIVKFIVLRLLESIFTTNNSVIHYISQITITNIFLGVILLITSIFMAFGPETLVVLLKYFGGVALVAGVIFKLVRTTFQISRGLQERPFQYFIYLCTLEIAPLLLLWRLVFS